MEETWPAPTTTRSSFLSLTVLAGVVACMLAGVAVAIPPPEAVGGLYLQASGRYLCTASVVSGPELGLLDELVVLTAAHCVVPALEPGADGSDWSSRLGFLLSLDNVTFHEVAPTRVGYLLAGYDLAILSFRGAPPDVAPLHMGSWETIDFGTEIQNFANPLGMGLQYFTGAVTMLRLEPSTEVEESNAQWRYNAVAALHVGPGSSGSLILNRELEYIGVLSSVIDPRFGSAFTVFVPQWKFADFLSDDHAGRDVRDVQDAQDMRHVTAWTESDSVMAHPASSRSCQMLFE